MHDFRIFHPQLHHYKQCRDLPNKMAITLQQNVEKNLGHALLKFQSNLLFLHHTFRFTPCMSKGYYICLNNMFMCAWASEYSVLYDNPDIWEELQILDNLIWLLKRFRRLFVAFIAWLEMWHFSMPIRASKSELSLLELSAYSSTRKISLPTMWDLDRLKTMFCHIPERKMDLFTNFSVDKRVVRDESNQRYSIERKKEWVEKPAVAFVPIRSAIKT